MKIIIKTITIVLLSFSLIGCGGEGSSAESSSFRENNNAPIINSKNTYYVNENTRKAFQIQASDKSRLEYSLSGGDFFHLYIDRHSGEVFFKEATNYNKKSTYIFDINVKDIVGHFASQSITIYVKKGTLENPLVIETSANHSLNGFNESDYFITTWSTDNKGTSNNKQIVIPTLGDGYNYSVDWGDGRSSKNVSKDGKHTYDTAGTYKVKIIGKFPRIYFGKDIDYNLTTINNDSRKLIAINQWGNIEWESMAGAFTECSKLEGLTTDSPKLSKVTNMTEMFFGAEKYNQVYLDGWDLSHVTSTAYMFAYASSFNQYLTHWNVSNVTDMRGMFSYANTFHQYIGTWDVSHVTDMGYMFNHDTAFNAYVRNWDTSNVTDMIGMFSGASSFNQEVDKWDISKVTNMVGMFSEAKTFNQDISDWNVTNVTNMSAMFANAEIFNQDISRWNIKNVTNINYMFVNAYAFNQDLEQWNVSNVKSMKAAFESTNSLITKPSWYKP